MSEHCVFCGQEIPEGRQLCPSCERETEQAISSHASANMPYTEAKRRIEAVANMVSRLASSTVFSFDDALLQVEISARDALQMKALGASPVFKSLLFHEIENSILYGDVHQKRRSHE